MNSLRSALRKLQLRLPQLRQVQGAGASLEVALARVERPESRPARLIEGTHFTAHAVPVDGPAVVTAFLDG
ncbi:MAG: hypothetical protein H7066_23150, partial [Cytophagaceae bacterium]|nr:hypothetical protein [Gemmatimonadaceae bacterium]